MHTYFIKTIQKPEEICRCEPLIITNYYWDSLVTPATSAQIGYLINQGYMVSMKTQASPTPAKYTNHQDPVYKDSAMECFLSFEEESYNAAYFNFEVNSNGAILSAYGPDRTHRTPLSIEEIEALKLLVTKLDDGYAWSIRFIIPNKLIQRYVTNDRTVANPISFNFYKICEDKSYRHYGSLAPLNSLTPNFHLPECFIKGHLT